MRSILITGSASGIGAAIVKKVASKDTSFTLTTKTNQAGLKKVVEYAQNKGAKVNVLCGDLTNKNFIKSLVELARQQTGNIDQFVANAGYADKKKFGEFNEKDLNRSIQTMTSSFSEIINLSIDDFKKSNSGRIVCISSFVNKNIGLNNNIFPVTAAAKGALEALTKTLAFQLSQNNVTVNSISPGYTKKDGKHSALSIEEWDEIISKIPLKRLAAPEDIANLTSFLLSNEASYITGQIIKIDGGLSLV
jgi:NAD(P)-dependent dehydrogenase (short-subunit alcohol dehydrogenase family)